jgi:hypothetical protein
MRGTDLASLAFLKPGGGGVAGRALRLTPPLSAGRG